jgi:hypothetical protein
MQTQERLLENYKTHYSQLLDSVNVGAIITDSVKYYKVLDFKKTDKVLFGFAVVDFTLQEVRFQRSTWSWVALNDPMDIQYNLYTLIRLSLAKEVDYVLYKDCLYNEDGEGIDTYLDIDPDDFDDSEYKVRYLTDDDSLYSEFRKQHNIIDHYNTVEAYVQEKATEEIKLTIEEERQRKLSFLNE